MRGIVHQRIQVTMGRASDSVTHVHASADTEQSLQLRGADRARHSNDASH